MGATCSSTALTRYNLIKRKLASRECLTFEAADGLLPRVEGTAPPVWLMGEDHNSNESDRLPKNKRNCALVLDLVKEAVSDCDTNGAEVVFIFENAVISDSEDLFIRDVNDDDFIGDPHHDVRVSRENAKKLAGLYPNVRLVYMDVFGRGRLFLDGSDENLDKIGWFDDDVGYIFNMVRDELREFWVTSGRYQKEEAKTKAALLTGSALIEINESALSTNITNLGVKYDQPPFQIFVAILCVKVAQKLLLSRYDEVGLTLKNADSKVIEELDKSIRDLFLEDYDIPAGLQKPVDDGKLDLESAMAMVLFSEYFGLLVKAGDAVLYEFITSLSYNPNPKSKSVVVMHAGYQHVHNQRRWLLGGLYDTDVERISGDLAQPEEFTENRSF